MQVKILNQREPPVTVVIKEEKSITATISNVEVIMQGDEVDENVEIPNLLEIYQIAKA